MFFQYVPRKAISQKEYEEAKAYDLKRLLPTEQANVNTEGYLYYTVLDKAVEIVMDLDMKKLKLIVMI